MKKTYTYDIAFFEVFEEEQQALRRCLPVKWRTLITSKTIQEAKYKKPPAAIVSVRTQSLIPASWAKELVGILSRSAGYDHLVDFLKKAKKTIPCGYLPDYCSRAVAEQAITLMLVLLRGIKQQARHFLTFDRDCLTGKECYRKKVLVVGVGKIGSEVVRMAKGLGMQVKGVDIKPKFKGIDYVSLHQGISWAQVVVCCLPLTMKTKGMLNFQCFKKAKNPLVFINIARGEISPLKDLKKLLCAGNLEAMGMDVFENEKGLACDLRRGKRTPRTRGIKKLSQKDNVILTPHNAFNTFESVERKAEKSVAAINVFLTKGRFPHAVPRTGSRDKGVKK